MPKGPKTLTQQNRDHAKRLDSNRSRDNSRRRNRSLLVLLAAFLLTWIVWEHKVTGPTAIAAQIVTTILYIYGFFLLFWSHDQSPK